MKKQVDVYVGNRLRLRRTMLGLSQEKLGKMVGLTYQQIQKYEKGVNKIGSSRLYQFARILLVPISYFFEGYENGVDSSDEAQNFVAHNVNNKEITQLVKNYVKIENPILRKSIITLAKNMKNGGSDE